MVYQHESGELLSPAVLTLIDEGRLAGRTDAEIVALVARTHNVTLRPEDLPVANMDDRDLQVARLDSIIKAYWVEARQGDKKAAALVLRAMERKATMLGYDAPSKMAVAHLDVTPSAGQEFTLMEPPWS